MPTEVLPKPSVLETWLEHPLVREAHHGLKDDATILDLFTNLHGILTELDERFPGLSFRAIQDASRNPDRCTVEAAMLAAGVSPDDVEVICTGPAVVPEDSSMTEDVMQMIHAGLPRRTWIARGFSSSRAKQLSAAKNPLTPTEQRAWYYLTQGMSSDAAAAAAGVSHTTALQARRKATYRRWLNRITSVSSSLSALGAVFAVGVL